MAEDSFLIKDPTAFTALTKIHHKAVTSCCFSPNSDQILTGSEDTTVVLWNLPDSDTVLHDDTINDEHKLVCHRLSDHKHPVTSVAMHKRVFLSASQEGKVNVWRTALEAHPSSTPTDVRFNQIPDSEPSTYKCHNGILRSVAFSPNAGRFATAADDMSVKIWSTECRNKMLVSFLDGHTNWIRCVRWSKVNRHLLASCGDDGRVCIWDTRLGVRQPPCEVITTRRRMQYKCLDWHPVFDHYLATGTQDSSCIIYDIRKQRQIQVYRHSDSVNSIAFNAGGSLLLTGSSDKSSKIFDVSVGREMFKLMSHSGPITSVCFNHDDEMFATASKDKTVTIWKRNFEIINIVQD